MHDPHAFLKAVTVVLCVAAVTTVVFQRLRWPVVLGYILAGIIVGPHVPLPLVADQGTVRTLSELGVILLMFSLGLDFSVRKLIRVGPAAGVSAVIETALMVVLGFGVGRVFGWTSKESLFTGAIIAISSTTIVARAFAERKVAGRRRELVVGVLVVEDVIAILLMATLTAIATGAGLSASAVAWTTGRLAAFLIGLVAVGMLVVPRSVRVVARLNRPETTLVASIGLCFAAALLAEEFGYSVALGAFIAGSLVAESGKEKAVQHLITPVRDMFAAIFFVSVGLMIDPALVLRHWPAVLVLTGVVVVGKIAGVSLAAFLSGSGTRLAVQSGMSLAQIGEFSFIIAGLGISLHATRGFLYPVAVSVSAITTLLSPWLIRAADPVASFVDRRLPGPLQTFATLYGTWIEELRTAAPATGLWASLRRWAGLMLLDVVLLAGWIVTSSLLLRTGVRTLVRHTGMGSSLVKALLIAGVVLVALPFCFGVLGLAGRIARALAEAALPPRGSGRADLATSPRRALTVTLQLVIVLLVGVPVTAFCQPFLRGFPGWLVLLVGVGGLAVSLWRSTQNLDGHVRAGAQVIVELLASQSSAPDPSLDSGTYKTLDKVSTVLPGLGAPVAFTIDPGSRAAGHSLSELNLRGLTGAIVLTVQRQGQNVLLPTAQEILRPGDVVSVAGSQDAVEAARSFFANVPPPARRA